MRHARPRLRSRRVAERGAVGVLGARTGWRTLLPATLAKPSQRLRQDPRPVLVGAALLDVGEMRLVRLSAKPSRRILPVEPRRLAAARAIPRLRRGGLDREEDLAHVPG